MDHSRRIASHNSRSSIDPHSLGPNVSNSTKTLSRTLTSPSYFPLAQHLHLLLQNESFSIVIVCRNNDAAGLNSRALDFRVVRVSSPTSAESIDPASLPYDIGSAWGPQRSHEEISQLYASILGQEMGNASGVYSVFPASPGSGNPQDPAQIEYYLIETMDTGSMVLGHLFKITNPIGRFKVHEPGNSTTQGCANRTLSRVSDTARFHNCRVATNAGFFNPYRTSPTFGECYGNLVVNGVPVRSPGTQNANFGLLKNGSFVTGYIPTDMVAKKAKNGEMTSEFETLIAGVVMIVKDGVNFVAASQKLENASTQTSGTIEQFSNSITARSIVGHDAQGNLLIFAINGSPKVATPYGLNLSTMADVMIEFGAINAINLDGSGSVTTVRDNVVINMPTDFAPGMSKWFHTERAVSSIICIEDPVVTHHVPTRIPSNPPSEVLIKRWKAIVITLAAVSIISLGVIVLLLIFYRRHARGGYTVLAS